MLVPSNAIKNNNHEDNPMCHDSGIENVITKLVNLIGMETSEANYCYMECTPPNWTFKDSFNPYCNSGYITFNLEYIMDKQKVFLLMMVQSYWNLVNVNMRVFITIVMHNTHTITNYLEKDLKPETLLLRSKV
jgi:hypothetical protein